MAAAVFDSRRVYSAAAGRYAEASERMWGWAAAGLAAQIGDLPTRADVLDAGCGPGGVTVRLARLLGPDARITGVDVSDEMLARAREQACNWGVENVSFECGDITALEACALPGASFDAVTAGLSLFLAPDPTATAAGLWRRVRPGGRMAVSVVGEQFFCPAFDHLLLILTDAYGGEPPYIPWRRVDHPDTLRAVLEQAGIPAPELRVEIRQVPLDQPDDWRDIMLGTGIRSLLEGLDDDTRAEVERASIDHVEEQRWRTLAFGVIFAWADKAVGPLS
jgi:SAM-dependent methyltransferase